MAASTRFERILLEPKSSVLPLDDKAMVRVERIKLSFPVWKTGVIITILHSLMAPRTGFGPVTLKLTASCSTAELTRNVVGKEGLEPSRLSPYAPKAYVATNYTIRPILKVQKHPSLIALARVF